LIKHVIKFKRSLKAKSINTERIAPPNLIKYVKLGYYCHDTRDLS